MTNRPRQKSAAAKSAQTAKPRRSPEYGYITTEAPPKKSGAAPKPVVHVEMTRSGVDGIFLLLVFALLIIGTATVYTASHVNALNSRQANSYYVIISQIRFAVSGVGLMFLAAWFAKYTILRKLTVVVFIITYIVNFITPFVGVSVNGAERWIGNGTFRFQPSEPLKLAAVMMFAWYIEKYGPAMKKTNWRTGVPVMLLAFIAAVCAMAVYLNFGSLTGAGFFGLVFVVLLLLKPVRAGIGGPVIILGAIFGVMAMQKHLSGLIIFALLGVAMMLLGETPLWFFAFPAVGGIWLWDAVKNNTIGVVEFLKHTPLAHAGNRLEMWGDPFKDQLGKGYQMVQSLYAISWGGLSGLGWGGSRQKHMFLPEPHNDFIFSVFCEEQGFLGALIIMALFAALIWRGFVIASRAPDKYASLLVMGIVMKIAIQALLNIAVVTDALPATGVPLPFFSYGGSALWVLLVEMGIILSVSRYSYRKSADNQNN